MRADSDRPDFLWWLAWLLLMVFAFGAGRYLLPYKSAPRTFAQPSPTPAPQPTPEPTPPPHIEVPGKLFLARGGLAKFNGLELHTQLETEPGSTATAESHTDASYQLNITLHVRVPKANTSVRELASLNPSLPEVLPALETLAKTARVSPFYEELYQRKLRSLRSALLKLDRPLSRHDFFDCETILELEHPQTKRRALLIQSDMDVDTDGSDPERVPSVDSSDPTFQPTTSFKWPRKNSTPNPFLAPRSAKLAQLQKDLKSAEKNSPRANELRAQIDDLKHEIDDLKKHSFLVAATDPYIVLPTAMVGKDGAFSPRIGDYCAVIYGNVLYPAVLGDAGPNHLIGEASLRIGKQINTNASGNNGSVLPLKVTYLVFPNTADKPFAAPDLDKWRAHCEQYLNELGGYGGQLFAWENLTKPKPTPTPTPTPSPTPSASPAPSPSPAPSANAMPSPKTSPRRE